MLKSTSTKLFLLMTALAASGCQLENIEKPICEIGETKCNDGKQLKCQAGEDHKAYWAETDSLCGGECKPGETKCSGGNIYTCTADEKWPDKATTECSEAECSEGTIQPASNPLTCYECNQDEFKCDGNNLITCINHRIIKTECEYGCVTAETNAYCRECKTDEKKCEKGFIVSCTKDGEKIGKWDDDHKQRCENGCFPGARGNGSEVSCYECSDADKLKCFRDDETKVTTIKRCLAHNWYDEDVCASGCVEGTEAKCKICNKGDKQYYNNEDGYCVEQECKDNQYQDVKTAEVSCKDDFSGVGECLNDTPKCENNNLQICTGGSWRNYGNCNSQAPCELLADKDCYDSLVGIRCENNQLQACKNNASCKSSGEGNLICASCQNETSICSENSVLSCQNGEYIPQEDCQPGSPGTHCEEKDGKAQCVQHDCENGQQRCQDNIIQTCENYKWKTTDACADGYSCYQSGDIAGCGCSAMSDICESYEICQDSVCQRMSCTENLSLCGEKCRNGECYTSNSNLLICEDDRVKAFWKSEDRLAMIDKILSSSSEEPCNDQVYIDFKYLIDTDGIKLCNQIEICNNPDTIGECMSNTVLQLVADGKKEFINFVVALEFIAKHSSCIKKCDSDKDCTPYQQCNLNHECVRKPCSKDILVCCDEEVKTKEDCEKQYRCDNDVCLLKCKPEDGKCDKGGKSAIICKDNILRTVICGEGEYCVGEGASVKCSPEG